MCQSLCFMASYELNSPLKGISAAAKKRRVTMLLMIVNQRISFSFTAPKLKWVKYEIFILVVKNLKIANCWFTTDIITFLDTQFPKRCSSFNRLLFVLLRTSCYWKYHCSQQTWLRLKFSVYFFHLPPLIPSFSCHIAANIFQIEKSNTEDREVSVGRVRIFRTDIH